MNSQNNPTTIAISIVIATTLIGLALLYSTPGGEDFRKEFEQWLPTIVVGSATAIAMWWWSKWRRKKISVGFMVIVAILFFYHFILPNILESELQGTLKQIEEKEGRPLREVFGERAKESKKIIEFIEGNGLRETIERQEGKPLEKIPIRRLKEIIGEQ